MPQTLSLDEMNALVRQPPGTLSVEEMGARLNEPTAEARSVSPAEAARGSIMPVDDPARSASGGTIARASLAPDPNDQIKRYAAARFPDMPLDQATKYYGVINGEVVYADPNDGRIYKEVSTLGETPSIDQLPARLGEQIMSGAGPAIPAAAGMLAGAVGMAKGPLAGMGMAAAGAAAGDVARQTLDRALAGEELTREGPGGVPIPNADYLNAAGQAALGAGGQAAGMAASRMVNRNPLGIQAYERIKARDPANLAEWQRLYAEAKRRGVDLSAGDVTDLASLKSTERVLRNYPETSDRIGDVIRKRNLTQVPNAVRAELDQIAPAPAGGAAEGGKMLRDAGDEIVKALQGNRTAVASPYYQQAFSSGVEPDIRPVLQVVARKMQTVGDATPAGRALKAIYGALTEPQKVVGPNGEEVIQRVPIRSYEKLHSVKESFDDIIQSAFQGDVTSAGKRAGRSVRDVQSTLRNVLKGAHPAYRRGAEEYARMSIPIDDVMNGAIGVLKKKDTVAASRYAEAIFDVANDIPPAEIAKARQYYVAAGKTDEWNAGVRSFLADRLDMAMKLNAPGSPGNVPGKFQSSVWGDPRQRAIMKAALHDSDRVAGFEKLMEVLQAAARSLPEGSPTASNLAGMARMDAPGSAASVAGKVLSPGSWLNVGNDIVRAFVDAKRPMDRIKLADALMSPSALTDLRKLRTLSPKTDEALRVTANILSRAGISATPAGSINEPEDAFPPSLLEGGAAPN